MREYALGDFECIFTYIMYAKDYYPDDNLVKEKTLETKHILIEQSRYKNFWFILLDMIAVEQ